MKARFLAPLLLLAACSATPSGTSDAYKSGSLGNGGFLFLCDDSVACSRWSGNAAKFPTAITTGSTFDLKYVATEDQGTVDVDPQYPGLTLEAVGPYMGHGPDGFAALQPGYGTVVAHDSDGNVIDFVSLHIVKPDSLVVYDAAYTGLNPVPIDDLSLAVGARQQMRTVGMENLTASAGSIGVQWTSEDVSILKVESYASGVVTVHALAAGKTTLTAVGAALTKTVSVEVK